jgi:hypothetical protein
MLKTFKLIDFYPQTCLENIKHKNVVIQEYTSNNWNCFYSNIYIYIYLWYICYQTKMSIFFFLKSSCNTQHKMWEYF